MQSRRAHICHHQHTQLKNDVTSLLILHVKKPMKPLQKAALSKRPLWLMLLEIITAATVDLLDVLRLEVDSAKVDTK